MIDSDDLTLLRNWCDDRTDRAFAELVRRHAVPVREACRRRLRDPAAADDAAQAVFLILASKAPGIIRSRWWSRPVIGDWLHRTAQHVCSNHERQRRRRERHEREAAMAMAAASEPSSATIERLRERVDAALAALPARYRQPVVLHYLEGRERAEVATALGLSEEALKKRLQRALEKLRGTLGVDEGASTALIAALAPLHADGGAQLAASVNAYLHGATIPAAVSIHVSGGLYAMRIFIAKTTIVSCVALAAAGGALAVAHAETSPAPAPAVPQVTLAQHPATGTVLYWDSLLDWTFDLGGSNPGQPEEWMVPKRMLEYVIFRGEVKASANGGQVVVAAPMFGWMIAEGKPEASLNGAALHGPDGKPIEFPGSQPLAAMQVDLSPANDPHPAQFQLTLGDDHIANAQVLDHRIADNGYGPLLDSMGMPDLLLPSPSAKWMLGETAPFKQGSATLVAADPPAFDYTFAHLDFPERELFTHEEQVFGQTIVIHVWVSATGAGKASVHWDAVAGLPTETVSTSTYHVQMHSGQAGGARTALLAGTLTLAREARLLHAKFDGAPTLHALEAEVRRERTQLWWERLTHADGRPMMHDMAFSVLNALENEPGDAKNPAAARPKGEF